MSFLDPCHINRTVKRSVYSVAIDFSSTNGEKKTSAFSSYQATRAKQRSKSAECPKKGPCNMKCSAESGYSKAYHGNAKHLSESKKVVFKKFKLVVGRAALSTKCKIMCWDVNVQYVSQKGKSSGALLFLRFHRFYGLRKLGRIFKVEMHAWLKASKFRNFCCWQFGAGVLKW